MNIGVIGSGTASKDLPAQLAAPGGSGIEPRLAPPADGGDCPVCIVGPQ